MGSRFDAYFRRHARINAWIWIAVVVVCLAVGFAVGQGTSVLLGGVAAIGLLILAELVLARVLRAMWLKDFPELRDPHIAWRGAWFLGTTKPRRQRGR